jgi:hypothetical protein
MKWNCPKCDFHWEGDMQTYNELSNHEKSHIKEKKDN